MNYFKKKIVWNIFLKAMMARQFKGFVLQIFLAYKLIEHRE